ncbi:MAG: hypothetical protein ACREMM_09780 [Gemmatimonadales bacterium]
MRHRLSPVLALALFAACQRPQQQAQAPQGPAPGTPEWKIHNAMSSAPEAIASAATIMDWPATPGGQMTQLRAGTNGWTCLPDEPNTPSSDPMCLDQSFLAWADAWQNKKPVQIKRVGFGYMLQGGEGSNTDPYATKPTPDNQWGKEGPHVMMVVPSVAALEGYTTDPKSGGPWVMWKGTPYAHVMMPIK